MKTRKAKLVTTKGGSGSTTFRATLPTSWIREMGLSEDNRNLKLIFDGKEIRIINNEEAVEMLNKLLDLAAIEIEKEMDRVGCIDDSDNIDRFLDTLARKLAEQELLQGNDDIELYYEKESDIEELSEELLEEIKSYMNKNYKLEGSTDDYGNYSGCYYR